ncbi:hypothetical protein [Humisphaera borealis]|uniref:Uncharacterized protein n=1 Tax=Humisphaera borealis TaxID=2807512 RepID=A0A7M2X4I4_9BACT|nr:hypothetical protein [Humisphaera borealis]QOV91680.1 hypothetical protein IPV69_10075 [Humisphaera borealis]
MLSLGWRLLPYLMVLGGLILLLGTLPVLIGGAETTPTSVAVADVSVESPKAKWLKLTGGGLYLPGAIVDEEIKKSTGARKTKAWYVPLIPESEAVERAKSIVNGTTRPSPGKLVLVRFDPDEFLRSYPTPENLKPGDVFRAVQVEGLRSSNILFPERLKDFVRSELQLPLESVVVVKFGDKPLQRESAMTMTGVLAGLVFVGVLWIIKRFRSSPKPPPLPV